MNISHVLYHCFRNISLDIVYVDQSNSMFEIVLLKMHNVFLVEKKEILIVSTHFLSGALNFTLYLNMILPLPGADVGQNTGLHGTFFRYPSYEQDIMGDIFSLGFGPFR